MATEVKLPELGQGMESGTIVRWLKSEGDAIRRNDPLYELDTDKVTQEVEADFDGVLLQIVVAEGEVQVGSTIAVVDQAGATDAPPAAAEPAADATPTAPPAAGTVAPVEAPATSSNGAAASVLPPGGRIKASPLARRIARERGVDLASLVGTGPDGRIVAEDVERAPTPGAAPAAPAAPAAVPAGRSRS